MTSSTFDHATLLNKSNLFKMADNFYQRWLQPLALTLAQVLLVMHKSAMFKPSTSWVTASAGRGMYPAAAAALWQFFREPESIGMQDIKVLYFATEHDLERKKYSLRLNEQSTCSERSPIEVDRTSSTSNTIDVEVMSFEELKEMAAALRHEKPQVSLDFDTWDTLYMWQKVRRTGGQVNCSRINPTRPSHVQSDECPPV